MTERIVLRALAVLAWLLATTVLVRSVQVTLQVLAPHAGDAPDESAMRLIARWAWSVALFYIGWRAWRRPAGIPGRMRRRLLRVVAVLAHEEVQRSYLESSPLTPLGEAIASDWQRAYTPALRGFEQAFDAAERAELAALDSDLKRLLASLPATNSAVEDSKLIGTDRAWAALRQRAAATFRRLGGVLAK